jgi:hypothetical protein
MKKCSPKTARSLGDVCSLRTDHYTVGDAWIIIDSDAQFVTIVNQNDGEPSTGQVELTKEQFNRMIRWYQTPTKNPKP